jgi:ribosomal peptide maturation radical SAM protein 1
MPWATALQPSIQLGILTARLRREGIATAGMYANLRFAQLVGLTEYERYGTYDSFFSQWVFSETLFGRFSPPPDVGPADFCDFAAEAGVPAHQLEELRRVKACVPGFLDECLAAFDWSRVKVVGFTTTLLQTLPSLALARVLKAAHPHLRILLGGAGCHGAMGPAIHRNFDFVDGVVDGEADLVIAPLVGSILAGRAPDPVPGLLWRGQPPSEAHPVLADLADYPAPAYEDYFAEARRVFGRLPFHVTRVPFEASRGCWWAVKRQCRFCGLNGEAVTQRARDVEAVVAELEHHHRVHGATFFFATDNIIAPTHVTHLPARIRERLPGVELFFETRVVMQRAHLQELAAAGIVHMQAGVESLVPEVLELTDKGTTPAGNLCFLRRSLEFRVRPYWNLLFGFPGESRAWYDALIEALPRLHHLPPPDVIQFSLQRFSPYFNEPERFGIRDVGPRAGSRYVWNLPPAEIADLSFDLAFEIDTTPELPALGEALRAAIRTWRGAAAELAATLEPDGSISIRDTRPAFAASYTLPPAEATILRGLEKPTTLRQLSQRLAQHLSSSSSSSSSSLAPTPPDLAAAVASLTARGLLYDDRGTHVALVVPRGPGFWLDERSPDTAAPRRAPGPNIFLPVLN